MGNEIALLCSNMPHGYHRDYQLMKDILFPTLELMHSCLDMVNYMLEHIEVNRNILSSKLYEYLFTVEEVNRRTLNGTPFREAYRDVGIEVNEGHFHYNGKDLSTLTADELQHTHIGSIGNLCNDRIATLMREAAEW